MVIILNNEYISTIVLFPPVMIGNISVPCGWDVVTAEFTVTVISIILH